MSKHSHNTHSPSLSEESTRSSGDVQVAGLAWFIVILTVAVVFVGWLMIGMLNILEGRETKAELATRPSPFAAQRNKLPPEPRLQLAPSTEDQIDKRQPPDLKTQNPLEEIKQLEAAWKDQVEHYGWVDEKAGVVRIPVEDAKQLLLQRGIPTRKQTQGTEANPTQPNRIESRESQPKAGPNLSPSDKSKEGKEQ
ncbi:MAG TPA: hypothetical protein VKM94_15285 [Blastocatellia bacterium]|nr:hypothetical protein [Blastocatellia bacterium]